MVAQAIQNPKTPGKPVKPVYKPHIRRESADTLSVQSERYVHVLYVQQVLDNGHVTCDCIAGSYGRPCKHAKIIADYVAYCAHPQHLRPQQEEEVAEDGGRRAPDLGRGGGGVRGADPADLRLPLTRSHLPRQ